MNISMHEGVLDWVRIKVHF